MADLLLIDQDKFIVRSEHEIIPCWLALVDQIDQDKFNGKSVMYAIAEHVCLPNWPGPI